MALGKGQAVMMYLAIKVPDEGWNYHSMVKSIQNWCTNEGSERHASIKEGLPISHPRNLIAAVSYNELQDKLKCRIKGNPEERWLVLSGNIIAEYEEPPIRFRQW